MLRLILVTTFMTAINGFNKNRLYIPYSIKPTPYLKKPTPPKYSIYKLRMN